MDINDKKIKRTSKIINWTIAIVLAFFLIALSNTIIGDLDSAVSSPNYEEFEDQLTLMKLDKESDRLYNIVDGFREVQQNYRTMQDVTIKNKNDEQESFENWVKARNTVGNPDQDSEVLKRTHEIDRLRNIAQQWTNKSDSIQKSIDSVNVKISDIYQQKQILNSQASEKYYTAMKEYSLKVFLVRLLFVGPILALGIFFFIRYRKHKFAALFMGFSLFSVYAFFVGLVPYLPSYGGYIRYTIGILLTIGLGYYAIKKLINYSEKKKAELKESTTERAKKLQNDITEKAYNNHVCPSCGKDFILKPWEAPIKNDKNMIEVKMATNFCRYCGLQLMKKCPKCEQLNYAHLPYCISCGSGLKDE